MSRRLFITIVIVVIVLIGGSFVYKIWQDKQSTEQSAGQLAADKTANWKTYRNEKYKFEMRYPPDWNLVDTTGILEENLLNIYVRDPDYNHGFTVAVYWSDPEDYLGDNVVGEPIKKLITVNARQVTAYLFPNGYSCHNYYDERLKAVRDLSPEDCSRITSFFVIPIRYNNNWYEIKASGDAQEMKEPYTLILSTFKFL